MARMMGMMAGALALGGCGSEAPAPAPRAEAETAVDEVVPVSGPPRHILAFGNSLFAGYNLAEDESYPAVLEKALRRRGINAEVVNAGVSGDTTQAGLQRLGFVLDNLKEQPDLAIVELGGNDLLRGLPPAETKANLAAILDELQRRGIPALLMGMRAPPNLGADYVSAFDAIYPALVVEYDAALVPFFMEPVATQPDLIQPDRVHPTAAGIEAMVTASVNQVAEALPTPEE